LLIFGQSPLLLSSERALEGMYASHKQALEATYAAHKLALEATYADRKHALAAMSGAHLGGGCS
jgi:hypothetical protein